MIPYEMKKEKSEAFDNLHGNSHGRVEANINQIPVELFFKQRSCHSH